MECHSISIGDHQINMNPERKEFLSLHTPPARLSTDEAAWLLGCAIHDVAILVRAGLLKPLGHPPPNGAKFFATATLMALRDDLKWLARASDALVEHWKAKNSRRNHLSTRGHEGGASPNNNRPINLLAANEVHPPNGVRHFQTPD